MYKLLLYAALLVCSVCLSLANEAAAATGLAKQDGVSVAFSIEPVSSAPGSGQELIEGQSANIRFAVSDQNDAALSGLFPAAWIHPSSDEDKGDQEVCTNKVKAFIGGSLLSKAKLDLNVYYVLTMNDDATISVVDPLFGFGGSKLLTMLPLSGIAYDWSLHEASNRVYVSIPDSNEIAMVDASNWQVSHYKSNGAWDKPTMVESHPANSSLWVLNNQGVAVFDQTPDTLRATIRTSEVPKALTFGDNGRFAYLLSDTQVSVVDTTSLQLVTALTVGKQAHSMDYSAQSSNLYISDNATGKVKVISSETNQIIGEIKSSPGITKLRFTPDGRLGFLLNPQTSQLQIIDSANDTVVQQAKVADQPEYVAFSDNLAYVRHAGSSDLYMVPLDSRDLGRPNVDIPTVDTPGGDTSPGKVGIPTGADGIIQAPGSNAVLISNYHDQAVYFYKEGMAAPMGQFNNYSKSPRAVLTLDHSLSERQTPGTYATSAVLPAAGQYQAVYFMDSPRAVHCFDFQIAASEKQQVEQTPLVFVKQRPELQLAVGRSNQLSFNAESTGAGLPAKATEFSVDILLSSGLWRDRKMARVDKDGKLALKFTPPLEGHYDVYIKQLNHDGQQAPQRFNYEAK